MQTARRFLELQEFQAAELQEMAVAGVLGIALEETETGTTAVVTYRVSGDSTHDLTGIAPVVDEVIGQHQTVIKPLSVYHRGIEGLAGSTILGDGSIALILDIEALVASANSPNKFVLKGMAAKTTPNQKKR